MTTILVTGASGFIGGHLVEHLSQRGQALRCLVRPSSNTAALDALGVEKVVGHLNDADSLRRALDGVSVVYHLAGQIHLSPSDDFSRVNGQGSDLLLSLCAEQATPPVVVITSSLAATGPTLNGRLPLESDPLNPVSDYGRSKQATEQAARRHAQRVPISIVRPGMVFGEGDQASLPLFSSVKHGLLTLARRQQPYTLVYVKDLVRLLVLMAERGERLSPQDQGDGQGIYFPGYAQPLTWEELGQTLARAMQVRPPRLLPLPGPLLSLVGAVADRWSALSGREVFLSSGKLQEARAGGWACDTGKIRRQFSFEPLKTLEQALSDTAAHYRAAGQL